MPDVLTHVFVGYVVGSLVAARRDDVGPAGVTIVMAGALSPDFVKIKLLVPDVIVESALGIPFSWAPLHAVGGTLVVALVSGLLVTSGHRHMTVTLIALGAVTHLFLDGLLLKPSGYTGAFFMPFSVHRPPAGMLYLSSDRWMAPVAATAAAVLWTWKRYRTRRNRST